jgi:hypothetical protein
MPSSAQALNGTRSMTLQLTTREQLKGQTFQFLDQLQRNVAEGGLSLSEPQSEIEAIFVEVLVEFQQSKQESNAAK